ncbi:hypothetical protein [Porphyromonas gingivalis]|uniref:hypothetical protein n=1 Tax=Porphyromonas gingivalis TaxID=837 RepID=UPI001F42AA09|nr:hypothetical protein [Porphyromonas gingivalis]MCE8165517.1 hypothetical protein [Porphyromonas gingivalis]
MSTDSCFLHDAGRDCQLILASCTDAGRDCQLILASCTDAGRDCQLILLPSMR